MKLDSLIGAVLFGLSLTVRALADATPETTLDALHKAGADANAAAFESRLAEDVVFLGIAGAGRLEGQAAREFFAVHLAQERIWAYRSSQREIRASADGNVAWFDETLEHDELGIGRGTGVLVRSREGWKVAQYNLTVPIIDGAAPATLGAGSPAAASPVGVTNSNPDVSQPKQPEEKNGA